MYFKNCCCQGGGGTIFICNYFGGYSFDAPHFSDKVAVDVV